MIKKQLYKTVLKLDYIPRYGRIYPMKGDKLPDRGYWKWQPQGMWGLALLDNLGVLDEALETIYKTDK
jgi:hypothetical protein